MTNEEFYDKEIAPLLLQAVDKCRERQMDMLAAVEFEPNHIGRTVAMSETSSLTMQMILIAAATAPNFDSLVMQILKHCAKHEISTKQSMVAQLLGANS